MKTENSLSSNLKSFLVQLDSRRSILIVISILIIIGSFLRVYGINKVYTEYDDIGVVSIHKAHIGSKTINPLEEFISYSYPLQVDMESAHSIENNLLLPFYIAYTWTYSPGQYVLLPLLLDEDDEFDVVLFKGRIISSIFSIMSICLLAYLMFILNGRVLTLVIPIVLTIPIFSSNSILYAHHMSPYSAYFFCTSLGLVLLYQYFISKISLRKFTLILSLLFYLSYLTLLFALPLFLIYLFKKRKRQGIDLYRKYKHDFTSFLLSLIIIIPGLLIMKRSSGGKGVMPPEYENISSLVDIAYHLAIQFYVSIESILYGVVRHDYLFVLLFFTIGLLFIKKLVKGYKKLNKTRIYLVSILSILLQWIILHVFGALPLDETRHMLIILPLFTIVIFYAFKDINFKGYSLLAILVISTATYSASIYSVNLIESKYSNFDYNLLNDRDEKVILLYRSTLGPLKYYDLSEKKVYFIDMNSFQNHYSKMDFPDEILLVSQQTQIFNEGLYDKYKNLLPDLFCNYSIQSLYEKDSGIYFTYNNYNKSSNKNGMFVYQMKKSHLKQC
jgi:hypothetical protein